MLQAGLKRFGWIVASRPDGHNPASGQDTLVENGHTTMVRRLDRQLQDYALVGVKLFWQRQTMFGVALLLAGYFYDFWMAAITLVIIAIVELYDTLSFRAILNEKRMTPTRARTHLRKILVGTTASATTIAFYAVWISVWQGQTTHFMPMIFLLAAGVFATMNNHQLVEALGIRLFIYGIAFILIPVRDIYLSWGNVPVEFWVQFLSSIYVVFFISDCARIFLKLYNGNLSKMEDLSKANHKMQEALKVKSEFLSTVSHELRTPLTSISGAIDLAAGGRAGEVSEGTSRLLNIAQRNCRALRKLIDDILDFQKMESHAINFEKQEILLNDIIEEAIEEISSFSSNHSCSSFYPLDPESIYSFADKARIKQVLNNLLSNAIKFSPSGTAIEIHLSFRSGRATVSVIDQGIGVEESQHNMIFEPFRQVDGTDTRAVGGTGLGLSISKRIVEAFDGKIGVINNPDQGATFFFSLPAYTKTEAEENSVRDSA